jgi:hypothetical protein
VIGAWVNYTFDDIGMKFCPSITREVSAMVLEFGSVDL